MVWTNDVRDPMEAEGEPGEGLPPQQQAAPALEPEVNLELDQQLPAAVVELQSLEAIGSAMRELQLSVAGMSATVSAFNERSAAQESIIGRMQQRLEELQGDQVRALLRPVYEQLAALHADITAVAERELRLTNDARLGKELAFLTNRVETAFESLGLVSVEAEAGTVFDSRLHAAVRSKPTPDAELDKSIAEVRRQGFVTPGTAKTELHARVVVYSFDPQAPGGHETRAAAPVNTVIAVDSSLGLTEAPSHAVTPAVTVRTEHTPQVPLPPMPPSYIEGS